MKNNFYNKNTYINLYEKPSYKSKISSQVIYGEKFKILSKKKGWLKIRTAFDKYVGYTKNLKTRLKLHNQGKGAKFTRGKKWKLVYYEKYDSKSEAMSREYSLKKNYKLRNKIIKNT